ncbi:hypothetical protein BH09SUM1_BH09SUM1_16890 [soil metagenome]
MSVLNSFEPLAFSQNARGQKSVYYVPSHHSEVAFDYLFKGKFRRLDSTFGYQDRGVTTTAVSDGECGSLASS